MIVNCITIGGWFQRTTLHLTELQAFFTGKDLPGLDQKILQKNLKALKILSVERIVDEMEFLSVTFADNLKLKIHEDGLISLKKIVTTKDISLLRREVDKIKNFYEKELAMAISYIFSRGAPIPKELAKIENIYPFIFQIEDSGGKIMPLFEIFKDGPNTKLSHNEVDIYKGKKLMIIENLNDKELFDLFAETEIFFREFKAQMARYLHIHREIWEKIKSIKERQNIRGKEIIPLREELQEEGKSINLIEARINQMPVYLKTRQKLTDISKTKNEIHPLFQFKFETLLDTHDYVKSLWTMTKNYLNSANETLGVLQTESTKSSISSLTLITTIGVTSGIITYLGRETYPNFTFVGFTFFLGLLALTFLINLAVVSYFKYKNYKLKK